MTRYCRDERRRAGREARLREPDLADATVVKKIRFYAKSQRDCGAASAVGAGTVAVSLLIGGGNVAYDAFYVLVAAQAVLMFGAQFFANQSAQWMGRGVPLLVNFLLFGCRSLLPHLAPTSLPS